jgi:hypothetical protein
LSSENPKTVTLSSWPVLVALGLVTLLIVGMLGLDVFFSQQESRISTDIIENSQRSITLLNNIRDHAKRLAVTSRVDEIIQLTKAIGEDARDYDPLATYQGEREEWTHLQGLLGELSWNRQRPASVVEGEIDNSIDKLLTINSLEGSHNVALIRAAHRQAVWSDAVVGGIVLATWPSSRSGCCVCSLANVGCWWNGLSFSTRRTESWRLLRGARPTTCAAR